MGKLISALVRFLGRPKSLTEASSLTFSIQVSLFFVGLGSSILLARGLGAGARGSYALMVLIATVLSRIGSLGLEASNVYYGARRGHPFSALVANSVWVALVAGAVLLVAALTISRLPVAQAYLQRNAIPLPLLFVLIGTVPLALMSGYIVSLLQGREHILEFNLVSFTISLTQLVLFVLLIGFWSAGLRGAVWGHVLAIGAGLALGLFFLHRITPIRLRADRAALHDGLSYGSKAYLANLTTFLTYRLDQLLLGFFLGPADVGFYAVAVSIVERLWMIPQSIATVLFPRTSAIGANQANLLTPRVARNVFALLLLLAGGLALLARPLILLLFGESFARSVVPLLWLLPGVVAIGYNKILVSDLAGRGRPEIALWVSILSLAVTVGLDLALIPRLGITGAAIASSVSYILPTLVVIVFFLRITHVMPRDLFIVKAVDLQAYWRLVRRTGKSVGLLK